MLRRLRVTLARRNVATMATIQRPAKPLVVVLGSTGTGKSDVRNSPCIAQVLVLTKLL